MASIKLLGSKMIGIIKTFIAGLLLGTADGFVEDNDEYERAKKIVLWSKPFLEDGYTRISFHLVLAKAEYALGNGAEAKQNYDKVLLELSKFPECNKHKEFEESLSKFKALYDY